MIEEKLAARLGWSIPALTIVASSIAHLLSGNFRDFPFFISEADHPGVERVIFTAGFVISGIILTYVSWLLFKNNKDNSRWYWMHISLVCGVLVGVNLTIMAFADMYNHIEIHVFTALNVFQFGIAWGIFTHLAIKDSNKTGKMIRRISIPTSIIAFVGLSYAINLGLQANPEFIDSHNWDMAKMQPWIDWASPFEYLLALSFIVTLASFEYDINTLKEEE